MTNNRISIVTVTYNAARILPGLVESLRTQTDRHFDWVVVDGGSTDDTLEIIQASGDIVAEWVSEPDFGIYDALNKGLGLVKGEYYLVLGADDRLAADAIEKFRDAIDYSGADVITARLTMGGKTVWKRRGPPWLYGAFSYISGHAVGTIFRRALHERFGYYSNRFPLAADQLFIKKIFKAGVSCHEADFVAGDFADGGASSVDVAGRLSEFFRVQLETERKWPQVIMYMMRLMKNFKRLCA